MAFFGAAHFLQLSCFGIRYKNVMIPSNPHCSLVLYRDYWGSRKILNRGMQSKWFNDPAIPSSNLDLVPAYISFWTGHYCYCACSILFNICIISWKQVATVESLAGLFNGSKFANSALKATFMNFIEFLV